MKAEQLTEALETAAAQLGVKVRYDALAAVNSSGGLCKVKGEWWVIIDKKATPSERAALLAESLATFDTDAVFLPPKAREAVQLHRNARAASGRPPS
jgi:hypothetical protein